MELEKRAHDLAVLYMLAEIKQGLIVVSPNDEAEDFVREYRHRFDQIAELIAYP